MLYSSTYMATVGVKGLRPMYIVKLMACADCPENSASSVFFRAGGGLFHSVTGNIVSHRYLKK